MNEENCPTCDTDPCKCENLTEGRMKELHGYIARGMSAQAIAKKMKLDVKTIEALMKEDLDEGKFTLPTRYVIVDKRTNKVTSASSDDKDLKLDVGRKSHLKIVKLKKPVSQKKTGYLLGEPLKAWGEEVELDEETVFVVRFEKEGMRFATPFRRMQDAKDGEKILKKSAGVSNVSITKDILKPGIKFSRKEGRI